MGKLLSEDISIDFHGHTIRSPNLKPGIADLSRSLGGNNHSIRYFSRVIVVNRAELICGFRKKASAYLREVQCVTFNGFRLYCSPIAFSSSVLQSEFGCGSFVYSHRNSTETTRKGIGLSDIDLSR